MRTNEPICYWNRKANREETELVYGDGALRWLYETRVGRWVAHHVLARPWISKLFGAVQNTRWSHRRIPAFIATFRIAADEFEEGPFDSFNAFFSRRFKPEARSFADEPGALPAFAEGRFLGYERVKAGQSYPVKGVDLTPERLLGDPDEVAPFVGGPLLIARLCPTDYHRYHYPDAGRTLRAWAVPGRLHSVNPVALRSRGEVFASNARRVSILETAQFGRLAYVEVGAMNVGKIVQTHPEDRPFARGDEKGHFLFGGSSILLLGEPGRWSIDDDVLERSGRKQETLIRLGDRLATA